MAKKTRWKNKILKSTGAAVIDVVRRAKGEDDASDSGEAGIVKFTLPKEGRLSKDLENCKVGFTGDKTDTILMVSTFVYYGYKSAV